MMIISVILSMVVILGEPTRVVEQQDITGVVERFVHAKLKQRSTMDDVTIEMRTSASSLPRIPIDATLRVVDNGSLELRNTVLFPIEVVENDRVERTFLVSAKIRRFGNVLITAEKIDRKQDGESVGTTSEKVETTTLPSDILSSRESLVGKRSKRIVNKGTVLTGSMFEQMPTVLQGNPVTLVVKTNSVLIKTQAIVREDGIQGEIVEVQKVGSRGRWKARVIDKHTVEIVAQN